MIKLQFKFKVKGKIICRKNTTFYFSFATFYFSTDIIYPRQARKMRMSGEVLVEFTWTKEKKLENLKILKPSKYDFLNKSALETIRIASKKFPQYEKTFHIKIPLVYKLS